MLNADEPRKENADTKVGLYIEIKEYNEHMIVEHVDRAKLLYDALAARGLGTIADCKDTIPIVI